MALRRFADWFSTPKSSPQIDRQNFVNVQIDAVGVGLAAAAAPFIPVFLTRMGASSWQVGLLSSMPALTGLLLAIPIGRYLERQAKIIPWFSFSRLGVIACYALTGVAGLIIRDQQLLIAAVLAIWALATLPQTILAITFSVVMNAVAGPAGRFELMTRRWSLLGLTTSITVFIIGQLLDNIPPPYNYPTVFLALSIGGLISYYFSSHLRLKDREIPPTTAKEPLSSRIKGYWAEISTEKPFISFLIKRFVYTTGISLALPLFPLFFVNVVKASDSTIAFINTAQVGVMIIGYFFWSQQSRARSSRLVLLWTTFGIGLYPILIAMTRSPSVLVALAGMAGIFQAGLDLVFFDELLRTVPPERSATFVSFAQSVQYIPTILAPLIGTLLSDWIGLPLALVAAGVIRLIGFLLFFIQKDARPGSSQSKPAGAG